MGSRTRLDAGGRVTDPGADEVVGPASCKVEVTVRYNAVRRNPFPWTLLGGI